MVGILAVALLALAGRSPLKVVTRATASSGCSVRTLHGTYGGARNSLALLGPLTGSPQPITTFVPVNAMEVSNWDGSGNFTGTPIGSTDNLRRALRP